MEEIAILAGDLQTNCDLLNVFISKNTGLLTNMSMSKNPACWYTVQ